MAKEIRMLEEIQEKKYIFRITKDIEINDYKQYTFEARGYQHHHITVKGRITLVLENKFS